MKLSASHLYACAHLHHKPHKCSCVCIYAHTYIVSILAGACICECIASDMLAFHSNKAYKK